MAVSKRPSNRSERALCLGIVAPLVADPARLPPAVAAFLSAAVAPAVAAYVTALAPPGSSIGRRSDQNAASGSTSARWSSAVSHAGGRSAASTRYVADHTPSMTVPASAIASAWAPVVTNASRSSSDSHTDTVHRSRPGTRPRNE